MEFSKVQMFGGRENGAYDYHFCGIYKIVSYREGEYLAFYIVDGQKNWGDFVSKPPSGSGVNRYWPTLLSAMVACAEHATKHKPSKATIARAAEIVASLRDKEAA